MAKRTYYILSGEGTGEGNWRKLDTTDRGIKCVLTRERCGGDRWVRAYYAIGNDPNTGIDVESGEARHLPGSLT